jgi:Ca2+-binding RTX toxin-like protein
MRRRLGIARGTGLALIALAGVAMLPAAAQGKPKCHGKKATVVLGGGNNKYVAKNHGHGTQVVIAGAGNDTIVTGKGPDVICGGDGNDRILAGKGKDRVYGGPGNDLIINIKGKDSSFGEDGNDELRGGPSAESMDGGAGDDLVDGSSDRDNLHGGLGSDVLLGGDGSDDIWGDDGNDTILGGGGGEDMFGGNGNDILYGQLLDDRMSGDGGEDIMIGGHGIDKMLGGDGDDWLRGDANGDQINGEAGTDRVSFASETPISGTTIGVEVDLAAGKALTHDGIDTIANIENVLGSAFDDEITGTGAANILDGNIGADKITGAGGGDTLIGGPGDDGTDVCSGGQSVSCDGTTPDPRSSQAIVHLDNRSVDSGLYVLGRLGNTSGGADDLRVTGAAGGFSVSSVAGAPLGILPNDRCSAVNNSEANCPAPTYPLSFITMWGDGGDDHLQLAGSYPGTLGATLDGGTGSDLLEGSPGDDILFSGESGSDTLRGAGGSDALLAVGTGGDTLDGGLGNDQFVTSDVCQGHVYQGGPGFDIAGFARYAWAPKNGVRATLGGSASDPARKDCAPTRIGSDLEILEGSSGPDELFGTNGKDPLIIGREGDDVIHGMGGADTLSGDGGTDTLYGDGGFDTLESQDGARDKLSDCGRNGGQALRDGSDPTRGCKKQKKGKNKRSK